MTAKGVFAALYTFFSRYGNAYVQDNVPDSARLPYLTYSVGFEEFNKHSTLTVNFYDSVSSYPKLLARAQEMLDDVTHGVWLDVEEGGEVVGSLIINDSSPQLQMYPSEDAHVKHLYCALDLQKIGD